MRIESARPEQYDAICAVIAEGDAAHVAQLPDVFCPTTGPVRPRAFLLERIKGPDSSILVALEDEGPREVVVGVLEIVMKPPIDRDGRIPRRVALVDNVVVRASHRGSGIGSRLMARAESWALEHGVDAIELNVWATNADAKRLYERLGYVTRLVRMERALTAATEQR
jgi:GNAT superfamily N-acetyltransferase